MVCNNYLSPEEALERYCDELTPFERNELFNYQAIYTIGSYRRFNTLGMADNEGYYLA